MNSEGLRSFLIRREWNHIDILAVSVKEKIVLCIENKIDSDERNGQLDGYRGLLEKCFPGPWTIALVYLTPDGREASDQEHWQEMSYKEIQEIIEYVQSNSERKTTNEASLLISNYLEVLGRDIVGDNTDIKKKCEEFYSRHRKALDLIFTNRPSSSVFLDGGQTDLPPEKDGFVIYQIQEGDTLSKIAKAHRTTVEQLMQVNPTIHDKDCITVGYYIYIPKSGG